MTDSTAKPAWRPFNTDVDRYWRGWATAAGASTGRAPFPDGPEADVAAERSAPSEPAAGERAADEPKREADAVVVETEETKDEETKDEETKDEETKDEETKDEETKDEETKDEETKDEAQGRGLNSGDHQAALPAADPPRSDRFQTGRSSDPPIGCPGIGHCKGSRKH